MQFEIRDNVAKPAITRARGGKTRKYDFAAMAVGQSFLVPFGSTDPKEIDLVKRRVRVAVGAYNKAHKNEGIKFSTVTETDGLGVYRDA